MRSQRLALIVFMIASTGATRAQSSPSAVEEAVRKADMAWAEAAASNNVDRMMAFYDADATFIGTSVPTVGLDRLRALWTSVFGRPGYKLTWRVERVEVATAGDLAYSYGPWEQTELRDGVARVSKGVYVAVWKKQRDGTWKVLVDKP